MTLFKLLTGRRNCTKCKVQYKMLHIGNMSQHSFSIVKNRIKRATVPDLSALLLPGIERLLDALDCDFVGVSQSPDSFALKLISPLSSVVSCGGKIRSINSKL